MNRESIDLRVKALERAVLDGDTKLIHGHILVFLRDLALEVAELHPEELTMEEAREYYEKEENSDINHTAKQRMERDKKVIERDKLAAELVQKITSFPNLYHSRILHLAHQLKEKLNVTDK